jgi:hypothetical protein
MVKLVQGDEKTLLQNKSKETTNESAKTSKKAEEATPNTRQHRLPRRKSPTSPEKPSNIVVPNTPSHFARSMERPSCQRIARPRTTTTMSHVKDRRLARSFPTIAEEAASHQDQGILEVATNGTLSSMTTPPRG